MIKTILALSLVGALSGCAPGLYTDPLTAMKSASGRQADAMALSVTQFLQKGGSRAEVVTLAKRAVAEGLKDPESARFRNVTFKEYGSDFIVCGEVNGKNLYGAYVGYRRFIAGVSDGYVEEPSGKDRVVRDALNLGLDAGCLGETLPLQEKPGAIRT